MKQQALTAALSLSVAGLSLIQNHEGLYQTVYLDPVGIPTVCWGHTEPGLKVGTQHSRAACDEYLVLDTQAAQIAVKELVKVPLSQEQYDALVSLVFNIGRSAFAHSSLLRKLNDGRYKEAADEFPRWVYARKRRLPGLESRRLAERTLFLRGTKLDP